MYKDLERGEVEARGWDGLNEAYEEIEEAVTRYGEHIQNRARV